MSHPERNPARCSGGTQSKGVPSLPREYDHTRQDYIESFGIRFLRVMNSDVFGNLQGVLGEIEAEIGKITTA